MAEEHEMAIEQISDGYSGTVGDRVADPIRHEGEQRKVERVRNRRVDAPRYKKAREAGRTATRNQCSHYRCRP